MKYCPNCGKENESGGRFCPSCGQDMQPSVNQQSSDNLQPQASSSSQYQNTNQPPTQNTTDAVSKAFSDKNTLPFVIIGWISVAFSLIFIPVVFGAVSVIMGFLVRTKGQPTHGMIMIIAGIAAAIMGMLIGFVIGANSYYY